MHKHPLILSLIFKVTNSSGHQVKSPPSKLIMYCHTLCKDILMGRQLRAQNSCGILAVTVPFSLSLAAGKDSLANSPQVLI